MTIQKHGASGLPTNAQITSREYETDMGETFEYEWTGAKNDALAKYNALKVLAQVGPSVRSVRLQNQNGRGRVMYRETVNVQGDPEIVEVYAVTAVQSVYLSEFFSAGGAAELDDDEVTWVRKCSEQNWSEDDITKSALDKNNVAVTWQQWANWTDAMKELRHHLQHGHEHDEDHRFVVRRSRYVHGRRQIKASFANIGQVVELPNFGGAIDSLLDSFPDGEWRKMPPYAEWLGDGKWRVTEEYAWAREYSVLYGGSWSLIDWSA